ncbi:MAG: M48 family metallopeptidase [Gloeomargaritaceae cyanobacterium C42_A2020_066]|nr:M48 family metallopeptidase [Gloeomargaritaceae cyanobacterium C42_A2020_066]
MAALTYRGLEIEVLRKPIKHLYLRVYPPAGRVCVSIPWQTSAPSLRHFLEQKWPWVEQQRARIIQSPASPAPQWVSGEQHPCLGQTYTLEVCEQMGQAHGVVIQGSTLILRVPPPAGRDVRQQVMETWYRQVLKTQIPPLLAHWQLQLGVEVTAWGVKKMKTRWGSCNTVTRRIWLSLELVHYPLPCIEQVLVHELIHLLERGHTPRFWALMDRYLPGWRTSRAMLNGRPPLDSPMN